MFAQNKGIFAVPGAGGRASLLIAVGPDELPLNPTMLPGNDEVLFTLVTNDATGHPGRSIVAQSPGSEDRRVVLEGGRDARYVRTTRQLIYDDSGTLMVVPFDATNPRPTGVPRPLMPGVAWAPVQQSSDFAVASNGSFVYRTNAQASLTLTWMDRSGRREPLGAPAQSYEYFRVSPDGAKVALSIRGHGDEIYTWDLTNERLTRLTFNPDYDGMPLWTPDSQRIVFQSVVGGQRMILRTASDGTGSAERLIVGGADFVNPNSITGDGSELIFRRIQPNAHNELWLLPLDGATPAQPLLPFEANAQLNGEVSPDRRWLAYQSNESGKFEVYLRPFPDVERGHWQVSSGGGIQPAWGHDGHELFYLAGSQLLSVGVRGDKTPEFGAPLMVLDVGFTPFDLSGRTYDVAPDGRFLIADSPLNAGRGAVVYDVVLNWTKE